MNRGSAALRRPVDPSAPFLAARHDVDAQRHDGGGRLPRIAKVALPLVALAIAAMIFAWSRVNLEVVRLQIRDSALATQEIDAISMVNAQFAGIDSKNRAFNVTAKVATQQPDNSDLINLQQANGDIVLDSGVHVAVDADTGQLQRAAQLLDLSGAVKLTDDRGYEFHTTKARIDLNQRTATGDAPVHGRGPDGEIQAEGFQIVDQGARVMFLGRTHATLRAKQDGETP
jgi:lipopolysaccharide export system protein LptC